MTENSTGNVWLDYKPESTLKSELKYYVETERRDPLINDITRLTLMDPACGSGHILVEGFDLLLKMYVEEGYTAKNAVTSIIKNNLFGLDIDDRASQLANFAVLLKAGKYNISLLENPVDTNILAFPEHYNFDDSEIETFIKSDNTDITIEELNKHKASISNALTLLNKGKNLGSVIKTNLPKNTFELVKSRYNYFEEQFNEDLLPVDKKSIWIELKPFIKVLIMLNNKYLSVVANPPYMGAKNMNEECKKYIEKEYPNSKSDLFAVFMEVCLNITANSAYMSMINQQSWMFLSSFEKLRKSIIENYTISSMLHLGPNAFKEISGEVVQSTAFVLINNNNLIIGTYFRLIDENTENKELYFLDKKNIYKNILQSNFSKIPGSPIAYWVSEKIIEVYKMSIPLYDVTISDGQTKTGENSKYIRNVWEIDKKNTGKNNKWRLYAKGGPFRRWFGNIIHVIDWSEEARIFYKKDKVARILPEYLWDKTGITWGLISSNIPSFRILPEESLFDVAGSSIFFIDHNILLLALGLLNTKLTLNLFRITNPTMSLQVNDVRNIPFNNELQGASYSNRITKIILENIQISETDWNRMEISDGYLNNILMKSNKSKYINVLYEDSQKYLSILFNQLLKNEEELNRIFIELYGLQDELTPEVPLKEVTILQDITYINENNELVFKKDEIIKQFLSYAIGCMMGRYSLYKEGLILANSGDTLEEYNKIVYEKIEKDPNHFMPDEDGIVPLMGSGYNFSDDITVRMRNFLEASFGQDTITENINFINECLGMDMDKFLTEKFWQYHYKMYQKKPIYWVFTSSNGSFKVLVYMHRMNKYTIQKIRNNYLLRHLSFLRNNIEQLSKKTRTPAEDKLLDKLRNEELECKDYDMLVKDKADKQIEFDLDDGVTVNYALFQDILTKIK
jgi:hypothetical protein